MSKPFSIQSPESIAKEYGGNKQRIAQAAQLGIVDPTAAVMAGMFIDRMRSAQMEEGAQKPTVAQQVMGGAPASPPVPPSGGLGATPQAAPPMAPQQPAPPPQGAPMGMADGGSIYAAPYTQGGLDSLPLPDTMFDESSNGGFDEGYAGGGLVAFADGGGLGWANSSVISPYGEKRSYEVHPGIDFGVANKTPIGVVGGGVVETASHDNVNGNYVIVRHPNGMTTSYSHLSTLDVKPGQQLGAGDLVGLSGNTGRVRGASGGYHLHFGAKDAEGRRIDPNDILKDPSILGTGDRPPAPERDQDTAAGLQPPSETLTSAIPDAFKAGEEYYAANMPERKNEGLDLLTEEARRVLDPAEQKKRRNEDKWMALAEIGFNMAASNSPYLLQAVGAAAAAALPGARAAKKEREAAKREAIRDLAAVEDITYKQAADKANFIREFATMQLGLKKDDLARITQMDIAKLQESGATDRTRMQVQGQQDVANINRKSYMDYGAQQTEQLRRQALLKAPEMAASAAQQDKNYQQAMRAGKRDEAQAILNQYTQYYLQQMGVGGGHQAAPAANAGQGRTVSQGRIINAVPIPQ